MKKICVVILTISILFCSIALFPLNTSAADNDDNIDINIYLSGNPTTPLLTRLIPKSNLNGWSGDNSFYLFVNIVNNDRGSYIRTEVIPYILYPNSNSVIGNYSTYSVLQILNDNGYSYKWDLDDPITYLYDSNNNQFIQERLDTGIMYMYGYLFDQSTQDFNFYLCYNNIDNPTIEVSGEFVFNIKNYETEETYFSVVIPCSDISNAIGSSDWTINKIIFGAKVFNFGEDNAIFSQGLYFEVKTSTNTYNYYIFELSEHLLSFTEIFVETDRQWLTLEYDEFNVGYFDVSLNSQSFYDFSIYVKQTYLDITDIYVNVYNYNATVLYDSTALRGTYLDYYLGFSFEKTIDGIITGNIFLNMKYDSDLVSSLSWSFNLNSYDVTDFKGVNFKIGQSYIDIPYDGQEKDLSYYGKFLPTQDNNIFSIYLIQGAEIEEIRLNNSVNYIKDSENKLNHFNESMNDLENEKSSYKAEGGYRVNNTVNELKNTMQSFNENAPQMNSIFRQVYDFPIVLTMLTLVLSVALISYVLYGKKG